MTTKQVKTLEQKQQAMAHARESKSLNTVVKPNDGLFMTVPEICVSYKIGKTTLRDLIAVNEKTIKMVKAGKQTRYLTKDIKEMMSQYQS